MSIPIPNYTQVPNIILDYWMPLLKDVQLKVLLFICRKTFGWHKIRDQISLSQLELGTGCGRGHISEAINCLEEHGLIKKIVVGENGSQKTFYELAIQENSNIYPVPEGNPTSSKREPTKETLTKDNERSACARETKEAKVTVKPPPAKTVQNTNRSEHKQPQRKDKPIPKFIEIAAIPFEDRQILANQFTEQQLALAMEDAKSYWKKMKPIANMAAFLTQRCKFYRDKK